MFLILDFVKRKRLIIHWRKTFYIHYTEIFFNETQYNQERTRLAIYWTVPVEFAWFLYIIIQLSQDWKRFKKVKIINKRNRIKSSMDLCNIKQSFALKRKKTNYKNNWQMRNNSNNNCRPISWNQSRQIVYCINLGIKLVLSIL